jgi:hypothetical protein
MLSINLSLGFPNSLLLSGYPTKILYLHVLHCSDYAYLYRLDPLSTAIWLICFDLIILSIRLRTIAYDSSINNNIDSLFAEVSVFNLTVSQALLLLYCYIGDSYFQALFIGFSGLF